MEVTNSDGNGICFPYDVLLHILRQLPCRPLAESRRVFKLPSENTQEYTGITTLGAEEPEDKTGQWASREFVPGPCAAGHLCDMVTAPRYTRVGMWKSAEYWRGSLYVHCQNNIIMILHISDGTYDMAQLPGKAYDENQYLGSSKLLDRAVVANYESGVHYVALDKFNLQSACTNLPTRRKSYDVDGDGDDDEEECIHEEDDSDDTTDNDDEDGHNHRGDAHEDEDGEIKSEEGSEYDSEDSPTDIDEEDESNGEDGSKYYWDSDEDNFIDLDESVVHFKDEESWQNYRVWGIHPHKDVVLLRNAIFGHIVAYHFKTSRIQHLGWHLVRGVGPSGAHAAFPYRPCYVDALPATKLLYNRSPFISWMHMKADG
uniref:F-box domain-containing protein n=1 Tax=Aegilops tauschii TaxID=37682 RepID=M8BGF5_AEGTA